MFSTSVDNCVDNSVRLGRDGLGACPPVERLDVFHEAAFKALIAAVSVSSHSVRERLPLCPPTEPLNRFL